MKLTIAQASVAFKILDAWVAYKKDSWEHAKLPLRVGRNMRKLSNELKEFEERKNKLIQDAAQKDENGKPMTKKEKVFNEETGAVEHKDTGLLVFEDEAGLLRQINEMAEEEIEVEIHPIPESWFEKDPAPSQLSFHADFLIAEEEK